MKPSVSFYTCTLHYFQNVVGLSEFIICALDTTPCIFSKTVFDFFFGVFRLSLHTSVHFVQPMYNSICQFRPTYLCCTTKTFWDSLLRSRAFIKLETLVCKYSVYFRGSEAQRTTDLLLLRFSSHWPHPLSFNRFAFAAHAALPLFTFCLFPHVQNVRLLLYLCSRFSASAFCPFVPAHS